MWWWRGDAWVFPKFLDKQGLLSSWVSVISYMGDGANYVVYAPRIGEALQAHKSELGAIILDRKMNMTG